MRDNQTYDVAEVLQDNLPERQFKNNIPNGTGDNQIINLANKGLDVFDTYQKRKQDVAENREITKRHKNQLDAEVRVISSDIERQRNKDDQVHEERMSEINTVAKMVDKAIETNDKEQFKLMAELLQNKFTGRISHKESDIDWAANNNKLNF